MQQATSAQREPSMEEILASIRRIIEDSDAARKQTEDASPAPAAAQPVRPEPAAERPKASVIDVDAFRAELRGKLEPEAKPVPAPAPVAQEAPKPKTLAEVQAEIMRSTRRQDPPAATAAVEKPAAAPAADVPVAVAPEREPARAPIAERSNAEAPRREVAFERPSPVPVSQPDIDDYPARPQPVARQKEAESPKPAIISAHAGRQVAAAFGELSEAFAESRKKSFDEMAEQMLRPMLQDWLDNNLPTLVERLVREEIERVARGG
jgi:cell pole-organizing protein PopZ